MEEKFSRKKARDVIAKFPRLRKPPGSMTTSELEEEEERRNCRSASGGPPPLKKQMNVEIYAYKKLEQIFKRDK